MFLNLVACALPVSEALAVPHAAVLVVLFPWLSDMYKVASQCLCAVYMVPPGAAMNASVCLLRVIPVYIGTCSWFMRGLGMHRGTAQMLSLSSRLQCSCTAIGTLA